MNAHLLDGRLGPFIHFFIVQGIQPVTENLGQNRLLLGLTIEQNILLGRKAGNQRKLLMHHADTGSQGIKGRRKADGLAIQEDVTAVAAGFPNHIHTEEDLHQGRLTGTVFADQAQDLAGFQSKVNVFENLVPEEVFLDISYLQQWSSIFFHKQFLTCENRGEKTSPLLCILFRSLITS